MSTAHDLIERFAIRCARGNNGGEWATHYTDEQKEFWRQFVRDMLSECHSTSDGGSMSGGGQPSPR